MSEPPKASSMGLILIVMGAFGMVFSVYHLKSARREFIAQFQFHPKLVRGCGNTDPPLSEEMERFIRDLPTR
jgi:hypothetical protein